MTDGPVLAAVRRRLLAGAVAAGHRLTPGPRVRVVAAGRVLPAVRVAAGWRVTLPAGLGSVRLQSRVWVPAQTNAETDDTRTLGVAVAGLRLDGRAVGLDDPRHLDGWHPAEAAWRWTRGDAGIDVAGVRALAFELATGGRYWADLPDAAAEVAGVP